MEKKELLYEGKGKKIYNTDEPDHIIIEFKDDAAAIASSYKGSIKNKGIINNKMSALIFKYLESYNISSHYVELLSDREMLAKNVDIIKVIVIMRNIAAGSLCKRFGIKEGEELSTPILEFYIKDKKLKKPLINEYHAYALKLATQDELKQMSQSALKINAVLKSFFQRRNLKLVDFKLEFGRHNNEILLADEISPDTCSLWDAETNERMDKDSFNKDLKKIEQIYAEVLERVSK